MKADSNAVRSPKAVLMFEAAARFVDLSGPDADWFALGGSSLDAARLVSVLKHELDIDLDLQVLLLAPSVQGLLEDQGATARVDQDSETSDHGPAFRSVSECWELLKSLPAREKIEIAQRLMASVAGDYGEIRSMR